MVYIVRVYYNNQIYSIDLSRMRVATIGAADNDSVKLDAYGLTRGHVEFVNTNDYWIIKSKSKLYRENSRISSERIKCENTYVLQTEPKIYIAIHPKQNDSQESVRLSEGIELRLGRDIGNDIVLNNIRTSSKHCIISKVGIYYRIKDCGSKNGTFVNGEKISEKNIYDGDVINISVYQIIFENNVLSFLNVGADIQFNVPTEEKANKNIEYEDIDKRGTESLFETKANETHEKREGTISLYD